MGIKYVLRKILPEACVKKLRDLKVALLSVFGRDIDYFYNEDFASNSKLRDKKWTQDFFELVTRVFNPRSIIDFGCGTGDILVPFEKKGLEVKGVDGSKYCRRRAKIKKEDFEIFDLRRKYDPGKKYDICLCLEVAEHVDEKFSDIFVGNLTGSSDIIIFSAAGPAQTGIQHINLKEKKWWIDKFLRVGFVVDSEPLDTLKKEMSMFENIQPYYIDNLIVFRRRQE
ncbi:MAG: methyltransferase domain-containing protein [Candidatus Omnitrophica bacterium]|nr:methyltransferase domain-containing protein [Candidatus Omnitrophota bacterium]